MEKASYELPPHFLGFYVANAPEKRHNYELGKIVDKMLPWLSEKMYIICTMV